MDKKRITSFDTLRTAAVAGIIFRHTKPFIGLGGYAFIAAGLIRTITAASLPFFFVMSGYFLAVPSGREGRLRFNGSARSGGWRKFLCFGVPSTFLCPNWTGPSLT